MSSKFESMTGEVDYLFDEYDSPPTNPIKLAQKWFEEAINCNVREPHAMVLTTISSSNIISSRVMVALEFANTGIIFNTHNCSQKIRDINENPIACGHFYWRELTRQLSISGKIKPLSRDRAIKEWNKRPTQLHSMSTASYQSQPLKSYKQLLSKAKILENRESLPCPEKYSVYILIPYVVEFWSASANRLHKRIRYEYTRNKWKQIKLQP